jgi:2-haloacid dehalogenase
MDTSEIRALTYDVFGTVVDWRGGIARDALQLLGNQKGYDFDWNAFAIAFKERSKMASSVAEADNRARRSIRADDLNRDNVNATLAEFGVEGLTEQDSAWLAKAWHRLDPWPDSVPGMTRLRTRYVLAAVSSGNVALLVEMARRGAIPWDVILSAEVTGYYKPKPEAYLRAVEMLGLEPEQCLMVASHNDDLLAAAACGLRTAFIRRPAEDAQDRLADAEAAPEVDLAVESMRELAERLGC